MLTTTIKTIGGVKFQLTPLPVLKAARLDKQVLALIAPVLGGFKGLSLEAELADMDLEVMARGVSMALQTLPDSAFTGLLRECLESVDYLPEGATPTNLGSEDAMGSVFSGRLDLLYKVVLEVMRFNRFTPFALVEAGGGLLKIAGSKKDSEKAGKGGLKLAPLATSTQN